MTSIPKRISPQQLKAMLHDGGELALFDVREAGQFGVSHLFFAVPLPYSRLEIDIAALAPRKSVRVVLCDDGVVGVAALAAQRLQALGYADLSVLDGGTQDWAAAGYPLFAGVNVPSKTFGELIEHGYHTPRISVQQLKRMQEAGDDLVVLDGRPYDEYRKMNIPGGVCCPNAELPYRVASIVRNPATKIVVNCAGRTRSIIGAQTLVNFGVSNPVFALENGTQGWVLADFELEHGSTRKYPEAIDQATLPALQASAQRLMERFAIPHAAAKTVAAWLADGDRTTYLCDVRTPEEFAAGSIPGARHTPGGQLIQSTDQWIGIRNARVVLIDDDGVRAPVVASWLKQAGWQAYVLEGGLQSGLEGAPIPQHALPSVPLIDAAALRRLIDADACTVFDLGSSRRYRSTHAPRSRWSIRPRIAADARGAKPPVVLVADDPDVARLAALDLADSGAAGVNVLEGGWAAWLAAGYRTEASPDMPADGQCIDYLYFVHDRHAGNRAAMRQYLEWEMGLLGQLDEQDRSVFRIGPTTANH